MLRYKYYIIVKKINRFTVNYIKTFIYCRCLTNFAVVAPNTPTLN